MAAQMVTEFGAQLADPARTAAVLRARAGAAGMDCVAATTADLAAAVVGAQGWMCATGALTLTSPRGPAEAAALAAVLCRAAGRADVCAGPGAVNLDQLWDGLDHTSPAPLSQRSLASLSFVAQWAVAHAGPAALAAAAFDLSRGWDSPRLSSVCEALLTLAESHDPAGAAGEDSAAGAVAEPA